MDDGQRDGTCHNLQQRYGARFAEKYGSHRDGKIVKEKCGNKSQEERKYRSCYQKMQGAGLVFLRCFCRDETGKTRLDPGGADCQDHTVDRGDQLENSQLFRTNRVREEYSVEETYNSADHPCQCQNEGTDQ